ncbi:YybH family protein [Photobacterium sp. J15]|uniref:YybH family protein n=1 Tax=Photobacterium sp. J15 TaxID=265901 RepID=UPI0007E4C16B|nr:SgcJ/EcaC family oxidoreductase [Photobacterium sp. J15]
MTDSVDVYDAIVAADNVFMTKFSQGDARGVAELYTEKGQFLPPNGDFVVGREAIKETFQAFMDMGIKVIKLETLEVEGYGDTATEVGKYILEDEGGQVLDEGKFMVIWKQEAGQWKLHRDMINSSVPAKE